MGFAVLGLRAAIRAIEKCCFVGRKHKTSTRKPQLFAENHSWSFSNCGVSYFGPFYVTIHRSSEKSLTLPFNCMITRAVRIGNVPSMDTDPCVMGIESYIVRSSTPSVVWSDNGTNFVGAENELILCVQNWNRQAPVVLIHKGIK